MSKQGSAIIEIKGLRTQFGQTIVHDNLDLVVQRGDVLSLVGGSGSGKTTLLRQMLGLETPIRGTVSVLGLDINRSSTAKLRQLHTYWGVLFQQGALFSALSVFENIALPMRELRVFPQNLISDAVMLKLQMVGLKPDDALKMPSDLSGGMIKRVGLARALALEPELVFLDEPTSGLDPSSSDSFVDLINSLHKELGLTVVMVSHDLDTILGLSSRIAVLAEKRVIALGTPEQVIEVDHPFIKDFFLGGRGIRALDGMSESVSTHQIQEEM